MACPNFTASNGARIAPHISWFQSYTLKPPSAPGRSWGHIWCPFLRPAASLLPIKMGNSGSPGEDCGLDPSSQQRRFQHSPAGEQKAPWMGAGAWWGKDKLSTLSSLPLFLCLVLLLGCSSKGQPPRCFPQPPTTLSAPLPRES